MIYLLLILYILGFISIMYVHYTNKSGKNYLICKTCTSIIFVIAAFWNMKSHFNLLWFSAFCFCLIGDIILGIDEGSRKRTINFILGVVAFALAHVLFIPVMWKVVPFEFHDLIFPVLMSIITFLLTRTSFMDTKGKDVACVIYGFIVSSLMTKGIQLYRADSSYLFIMLGTILFCISDVILFFQYFCVKKIKCLKFFNLLTYYAATMLLALSTISL